MSRPIIKADGSSVRARRKQIVKQKHTAKTIGKENTARHRLKPVSSGSINRDKHRG